MSNILNAQQRRPLKDNLQNNANQMCFYKSIQMNITPAPNDESDNGSTILAAEVVISIVIITALFLNVLIVAVILLMKKQRKRNQDHEHQHATDYVRL